MKKVTLFFILFFLFFNAKSQNYEHGKIEVRASSQLGVPTMVNGKVVFGDSNLQALMDSHNVNGFDQIYKRALEFDHPLAEPLSRVYVLNCDCNETNLMNDLQANASQFYDRFYFVEIPEMLGGRYITDDPFNDNPEDNPLLGGNDGWRTWFLTSTNAFEAWCLTKGNTNISIGICDSGFDLEHEDLASEIVEDNDPPYGNHGTQVAGLASAATDNGIGVAGIGFNTTIIAYGGSSGGMTFPNFVNAVDDGARVINASFLSSCEPNAIAQDAITMLVDQGVVIVAASANGNYGPDCNVHGLAYPASYDGVISVSSYGRTDRFESDPSEDFCSPSNGCGDPIDLPVGTPQVSTHNTRVDVVAPARCVYVMNAGGGYAFGCNGTSLASPIVAGVVGLMLSVNPNLTPAEVRDILVNTGRDISGVGNNASYYPSPNDVPPAVDAYAAVLAAMGGTRVENNINGAYEVSGNETWNNFRDVDEDVIIPDGATLTVSSKVAMNEGKKIIVKEGGRLNIYGGHITTDLCGKWWGGIEVWRNSSDKGFVHMSGGTVEHARDAVLTYDSGYLDGTGQDKKYGGTVIATGSTFLNNRRGVDFNNYDFNLYPYFFETDFIIDDNYRGTFPKDYFDAHITFSMASGIQIHECNFYNNTTTPTPSDNVKILGEGIRSGDGGFEVRNSLFRGFEHGANASNTCNQFTFKIEDSSFDNNFIGVRVNAVNNFWVLRSDFDIGFANIYASDDNDYRAGLINLSGSGFKIQENNFISSPTLAEKYGIWMDDTNEIISESNIVDLNNYEGLDFANFATGDNKNNQPDGGLEYICNDNIDNLGFDFMAFGGLGIAEFQGGFTLNGSEPAGNTFSNVASNPSFWHFYNNGEPFTYLYSGAGQNPSSLNFTFNTIAPSLATLDNQCSQLEPTPGDTKLKFDLHQSDYISLHDDLMQLMDNGSTNDLITQINEATTETADALKSNLLQISPYLSTDVLKEFAVREDIFSNQDIYDVVVANPEEARKFDLQTFLIEKNTPMSDAMMASLITDAANLSERGESEALRHYHYKEMTQAANQILFSLKTDSLAYDFDEVKTWIGNKENKLPPYGLIELTIRQGDYLSAQNMISNISQDFELSPFQQEEHDNFVIIKNLQIDLYNNGSTWAALTLDNLPTIETIANESEGWTGVQARHILNHYFGYDYNLIPPSLNDDSTNESANLFINESSNSINEIIKMVKATPNPASDNVIFDFHNLNYKEDNFLYVKDINGNLIKTFNLQEDNGNVQWNTDNIHSGIYIYYIETNGKVKSIQKLVIMK